MLLAVSCSALAPSGMSSGVPAESSVPYIPSARNMQQTQPAPTMFDLSGHPLSLRECISLAWENNPRTRGSWQSMQSMAAQAGQARSERYPEVEATAGAGRSEQFSPSAQRAPGTSNSFSTSLGISYLLFDGGARSASIENADAALVSAGFRHNAVLQDIALDVAEAYYRLLAANQFVRVAEQVIEQTQNHVNAAQARYESGIVNRSDMLRAETDRADAELSRVRAQSQVRLARAGLANALGLNVTDSLSILDLPEDIPETQVDDVRELIAEALSNRPEIRSSLAQIDAGRAEVRLSRSRYWPSLTTSAGFGWFDREFLPEQRDWSIGIGLRIPVFDGFDRGYALRRSDADLSRVIAEHAQLSQGIELEVWNAYSGLIEAQEAIRAVNVLTASADEALRVAEGEYLNGVGSIILLIDAQTAQTSARVRQVQARLDWYTALSRMERVVGNSLLGEGTVFQGGNR